MSEHEKQLRAVLQTLAGVVPKLGAEALRLLDLLLAEQETVGLEDAMAVFSARQAKMRAEALKKGAMPEKVKDCADDAKRSSWALHVLRIEATRRKKARKG